MCYTCILNYQHCVLYLNSLSATFPAADGTEKE